MISTEKKFPLGKFLIFSLSILCLVALPLTSAVAGPSDNSKKNIWNIPSKDFNKIDNNLVWYINENDLRSSDPIKIVVDYENRPSLSHENRLTSLGGEVLYVSKYLNSIVVTVTVRNIGEIASQKDVVRVEFAPDGQFTLSSALPTIGVPSVWNTLGNRGEGVTIAVVDSGIDDEHVGLDDLDDDPATDDPKVIAFYDAAGHPNQDDGTYEPFDNHGHGSHVAGTAAGTGAPGYQNIGVAPQAKLVGVRIGDGSIGYNNALRGVEWVIANKEKFGIDIMSNSWGLFIGGPSNQNGQSTLSLLMDEAVDAGITVFCAAGNTAISLTVYSPADSEKAITVGSVNDNHVLSLFSSQGPTADGRIKPDICAVGEDVRAPNANSGTGYVSMSGTSMSTPMAAGLGALIIDANPYLTPLEIKQLFHETSEHNIDARFPISPNNGYGWGVVEAFGAVKRARDLAQTHITALPAVHEGDIITFSANTTYTRTLFTNKGLDGMRLIGDDELLLQVSIPANWSIPFNISVTSEGTMEYDAIFSVPRFEDGMWIIEAEFHYDEDVDVPTYATPIIMFQSMTPTLDFDTTYPIFYNMTLNGVNGTPTIRNITVDNQDPPVIWIDTPSESEKVSGIVTIAGSAYDPDVNDDVELVYIKIQDEDWDIANGTNDWGYIWNTTVLNNGWYSISVVANDGEENSTMVSISVELDNLNLQPSAIIDSISPNPANEGEDVSFSGHGSDSDGFIVEYEWKSNIQGILSTSDTFSSTILSVGIHEIWFRVKDNDGVWSQKAILNLRINQIPIAHIDSISPNPVTEGEPANFIGHGSDDRTIIAYNWRSSNEGFLSDLASFSGILSPGVHEIYLRVQDDDGVWSEEVMLSLRVNQIPVATIDGISPNPATENDTVYFSGYGSDDQSVIAYEWSSDIDGLLDEIDIFPSDSLSVGEHVISFRVKDNDNVWSEHVYQSLQIKPVPTAFIDSISPNPANESESVTFVGYGEDVGEIINYSWSSSIDGHLSSAASFSTSTLIPGIHTIYFAVENDNETWSEDVTGQLRINGEPTAFIDTIYPNPALEGEEVHFDGHGIDDNEIINYSWLSSIDGFLGSMAYVSLDSLSLGNHTIRFSVQDSDFIWSDEVYFNLRIHKRPTAVIDDISPAFVNEGDEVFFEGHGSDDGGIAGYEWSSSINGTISTESSFSTSGLSIGEHEISFRVRDDDGVWSEYDTFSIRINQIPIAYIDSISPDPANEDQSVSFTGHGADDRAISGYSWHSSIDGFISTSDSFSTTSLADGVHTIYFKVKDDDDVWSGEVTSTLRINRIPIAFIDSIDPLKANEGETISFDGHGEDDGSIIAYNWTSTIDGHISTQKSFSLSSLSVGNHLIILTVKDNDNTWSTEVKRILRVNQIPQATIDFIAPNPALTNDNIRFEGHGVDDVAIVEYLWSSSIDGIFSSSMNLNWLGLSSGQHLITFKVMDTDGMWSQEKEFGLTIHDRPQAKIKAILPAAPNEGDKISFIGEGIDDGIIMEYNWTSNIDGFLGGSEMFETTLSSGVHTISLTVKDDMNVWSKKMVSTIHVNKIPEAFIDSISPNPAEEGQLVILSGHGEDDGFISSYEWSSSLDGIIGTDSLMSLSDISIGNHDIHFKVEDNDGAWSSETVLKLTISGRINKIPTVVLISPLYGDVVSDEIFIQAEAFDEDGQIESIEVKMDDNNWFQVSDSAFAFYPLKTKDMSKGDHVVYVRAYDGESYSQEEFVIVKVVPEEEEGGLMGGENLFLISFIVVIVLVVAIILLIWLSGGRRRRGSGFIRI